MVRSQQPIIVNTDLRGKEWSNPVAVAKALRYAYVAGGGMLAGTDYGKIMAYLSRHPGLMARVIKVLGRFGK